VGVAARAGLAPWVARVHRRLRILGAGSARAYRRRRTCEQRAGRLAHRRRYLAIGAAITILDSLVDRAEDLAGGRPGFIGLYEDGELQARLPAVVREALARAHEAPHGDHHVMTLAGVVAYYSTHPGRATRP
jgi:hypothetical protein